MTPDSVWLELLRIFRELGGPKPPDNPLARHQGEPSAEPSTADPRTLKAERLNECRRMLRRQLVAAGSIGRGDIVQEIQRVLARLGQETRAVMRYAKRDVRVWRAPDTPDTPGGGA